MTHVTGHVIVRRSAQTVLSDPLISVQLPENKLVKLLPILGKDAEDWDDDDDCVVKHALDWAWHHCT